MNVRTRQGLIVIGAALALGILGDALLRATPCGLNLLVWIAALAGAGAALACWPQGGAAAIARRRRRTGPQGHGEGAWLLVPILFFAGTFAWRDSPTLTLLNSLGLVIALALAALRARSGRFRVAGLADYARDVCVAGLNAAFGFFPLICLDIGWKEIPSSRWIGAARAVGRGLAIAVPLLLLFGGLFVAADAAFEGIIARLFRWDLDALGAQLGRTLLCAWLVGGLLRVMLWAQGDASRAGEPPARFSLGIIEVGVVLGLLDLLFLAFVCVQLRYLFGGAALIAATSGLTCADYARRGFFELVTVTALVLPVLLLAHGLLRKEQPTHEGLFRALATVLLALLAVVMASAVQRMRHYVAAYGLTELRFYTTSFMGWLALLSLWFFATVLCGRRERFAFGALVTGFLAIATLDGLNPDAVIVSANAARMDMVVPMDAEYVSSLSADAVPVLVDALPAMNEAQRATAAAQLLSAWASPSSRDWRTWNWSRAQAWKAIRAQQQLLQEAARSTPSRRYGDVTGIALAGLAGGQSRVPTHLTPSEQDATWTTSSPVSALSWSPVGQQLVYVAGPHLYDWPRGRRITLPREVIEDGDPTANPLAWAIKWRPDGQEFAVLYTKSAAAVIDAREFKVKRTLPEVEAVWWMDQTLCYAPKLDGGQFGTSDRSPWYCGRKKQFGPRGLLILDVSPCGRALLARMAGEKVPGWSFHNLILMRRDPRSGKTVWRKQVFPRPAPLLEGSNTDQLVWNDSLQSAAVVQEAETGGGLELSRLHLVRPDQAYTLDDETATVLALMCPPSWVGNDVLCVVEARSALPDRTICDRKLVLLKPWRRHLDTVLKDPELLTAAAARDGRTIAYAIMKAKRCQLVISSSLLSSPSAPNVQPTSRDDRPR